MRGPTRALFAWVFFVGFYLVLYVFTLYLDAPHFKELLNASVTGVPANLSRSYELSLVLTSPFNPLEDFIYPSPLAGYVLNFVFSVAAFSLYSMLSMMTVKGVSSPVRDFLWYCVSLPLLSSYIYVGSEYALSGLVITGTSTFGVTTLFSPLVSVAEVGMTGNVMWMLTGMTAVVLIAEVAVGTVAGTYSVPSFVVLLSLFVIYLDIAYFTVRAVVTVRPLLRKVAAVFVAVASFLLANVFYLEPTQYGINLNHLGALLVFFTLGFAVAKVMHSNRFITGT